MEAKFKLGDKVTTSHPLWVIFPQDWLPDIMRNRYKGGYFVVTEVNGPYFRVNDIRWWLTPERFELFDEDFY